MNRSRIDHFLCSENLSLGISNIEYLNLASALFDHKPILATFGKKKKSSIKSIDANLLHINESVKFSVYELVLDNFDIPEKDIYQNHLVQINLLNASLSNLSKYLDVYPNDQLLKTWIHDIETDISDTCNLFPNFDDLISNNNCNLELDSFLESLLNTVKNCSISFQSNYLKTLKVNKLKLIRELNFAKNSQISDLNNNKIRILDSELCKLEDEENLK